MRDLMIHDLQVEDSVYKRPPCFEVRHRPGYSELNVPVTLREKGKPEILARQMRDDRAASWSGPAHLSAA